MEEFNDPEVEETQVNIPDMLELQVSEIEMLQSMFPNSDELRLDDPAVIAEIRQYLDGKLAYEYLQNRIGFTLKITPGNQKVTIEVVCLYPHEYPSVAPCVFTRCEQMDRTSHSQLNEDLQQYILGVDRGEICMFSVIEWIQENFVKYLKKQQPTKIKKKDIEFDKTFSRLWIYSHHLFSKFKRRDIVDWALEMKLTGFSLPGKPGIICVEGYSQNIDDYWSRLRALAWKKIVIREREDNAIGKKNINEFHKFDKFEEKVFEVRAARGREYRMDMGLFCDFLNEHNCGHIFSCYFGVDGKGTSSSVT
ncbi:RWD domain-containing protein 2B-like [Mytilus californianus]|uniref:RWD domain-containing protein 2B-like n=1 Tax=Mytilus californianus TaxID=6549 RepID=UPI00224623D9|nr:RWD domain-containing protein 2B-like [Mytilus californianus]XP_052078150.1 RWD domain-containing protein 2B-like [Mytilus californianus]